MRASCGIFDGAYTKQTPNIRRTDANWLFDA